MFVYYLYTSYVYDQSFKQHQFIIWTLNKSHIAKVAMAYMLTEKKNPIFRILAWKCTLELYTKHILSRLRVILIYAVVQNSECDGDDAFFFANFSTYPFFFSFFFLCYFLHEIHFQTSNFGFKSEVWDGIFGRLYLLIAFFSCLLFNMLNKRFLNLNQNFENNSWFLSEYESLKSNIAHYSIT